MAKALMVLAHTTTLTSGEFVNLLGSSDDTTTEANTQMSCTEAATFSTLGIRVTGGNSGTLTLRFRKAGADGNQVVSFSGTGSGEDTTNTDSLSAADLLSVSYTDTGSNSTPAWIKGNVEFSSGHGNFHAAATFGGVVCDVASSTRFIGLSGDLIPDGNSVEAEAGWKTRGYTAFEALQVRVTANARTNDSVFRNRINGADGTGVITFGAAATGLLTATGLADSLSDGQTSNASMTLSAGVEDLTVAIVGGTFKSSSTKSESWIGTNATAGTSRTASATANYVPIGGFISGLGTVETDKRIKVGFAGVASNLRCYLSGNTYASDGTLKLYQNGVAVITTTLTASGGAGWYENTTDTVTFDDNDEFSFELDEGGASGSVSIHMIGVTFGPSGVTPGSADLTITGQAPNTGTGIKPSSAALQITGDAPRVIPGTNVRPDSAALVIDGQAPTKSLGFRPDAASLTLDGQAPTTVTTLRPSTADLTITGNAPTALIGVQRTPQSASLVLEGQAPDLDIGIRPASASLTIDGQSADLDFAIRPSSADLVIDGQQPTLSVSANVAITPGTADLTITGNAPQVVGGEVEIRAPTGGGRSRRGKRKRYELPNGLHVYATVEEAQALAKELLNLDVDVAEEAEETRALVRPAAIHEVRQRPALRVTHAQRPKSADAFIAFTQRADLEMIAYERLVDTIRRRRKAAAILLLS